MPDFLIFCTKLELVAISHKNPLARIKELGFNFLNKIIVFFVESQVQKSIFGVFCQCLYSYQNKEPRGARVQNHSTVTRGCLKNLQNAILLGLE